MSAKNFGTGVSRVLDAQERAWHEVITNQGRPAFAYEINLLQDVESLLRQDDRRTVLPSGFLTFPDFSFPDDNDNPNSLDLPGSGGESLVAHVNGWTIPVQGTVLPDFGTGVRETGNRVILPAAPETGLRTDLVYLEVWLALVSGNSDVEPIKPPARNRLDRDGTIIRKSQVWPFGNILYGGDTLDDDIIDPDARVETTKRVQRQYAIRVWENVDLGAWPRGLGQPNIIGIGPQDISNPFVAGSSFTNIGGETGDFGVWVSELPEVTVDGKVYAIPICAVHRRNSAGFDPVTNPNGSSPKADAGLAARTDGLASDRIFAEDITDLRHRAVLSPDAANAVVDRSVRDLMAGELATSFGSDPVSSDVAGSTVSITKLLVPQPDFTSLRSDHIGFADGVRRVWSDEPVVEKNVLLAIRSPVVGDPWSAVDNTVTLTLPAESPAQFALREPRAVIPVTQEAIVFNAVEVEPVNRKTITMSFGVGTTDGASTVQDIWFFFDLEFPPATGLRSHPLRMHSVKATSIPLTEVSVDGQRVLASSQNRTFYGRVYRGDDGRLTAPVRRLAAPLEDGRITEDSTTFFEEMFDLDLYLDDVDARPVSDEELTVSFLSRYVDSLVDLDDDVFNIDAGWIPGRQGLFVRPVNATESTNSGVSELSMSTHAFYVIDSADKPASVPIFTMISPLPLLHIRGAYLNQTRNATDYADPSALGDEFLGNIVTDELGSAGNIVDRGDGVNTYRLMQSPVMQVLKITRTNPDLSTTDVFDLGRLRNGTTGELIVPVYIRKNGATDQIALLKQTKTAVETTFEKFEFSTDASSTDYIGNFKFTYRRASDVTVAPGDTDFLFQTSDYASDKQTSFPPDGRTFFTSNSIFNGTEVFLDADIRVPLPLNSEIAFPFTHAPRQNASLETDIFDIVGIPDTMFVTTAGDTLGAAILPNYAGNVTETVAVSQNPVGSGPDNDFQGGPITLFGSSAGSAITNVPIVGSAGRDPLFSLVGTTVRLRQTVDADIFDALLGSDGNAVRAIAEGSVISADGEVAAYIPVTARAATGEIVILMMSQRNLGSGQPVIDTRSPHFRVSVFRPVRRPLVRSGDGEAQSHSA